MGKGVGPYDCLIRLYGHAHGIGYQAAEGVQVLCLYVGIKSKLFVLFDHHYYFFQGGVAGAFAQSVDGTFDLPGTAADAGVELAVSRPGSFWPWPGKTGFSVVFTVFAG